MGEQLAEWAPGKLEELGSGIEKALDDLHNGEHKGGPFENDLESARAYLLTQLQEKYGLEFAVVGKSGKLWAAGWSHLYLRCCTGKCAGAGDNGPCIPDDVSGCSGRLRCVFLQGRGRGACFDALRK